MTRGELLVAIKDWYLKEESKSFSVLLKEMFKPSKMPARIILIGLWVWLDLKEGRFGNMSASIEFNIRLYLLCLFVIALLEQITIVCIKLRLIKRRRKK